MRSSFNLKSTIYSTVLCTYKADLKCIVWPRFGKARLKLSIFTNKPPPLHLGSQAASTASASELPESDQARLIQHAVWIPCVRNPPSAPYYMSDGFDVYVDACRLLPDYDTFTKARLPLPMLFTPGPAPDPEPGSLMARV